MDNEWDRDPFSLHVRSGHVNSRFVGISILLLSSGAVPCLLGLDWQIQTGGLNSYLDCILDSNLFAPFAQMFPDICGYTMSDSFYAK